ncbi:MAG: hypothetical protein K8E66_09530, partial [Phycisphaerales bacterium]|nr:hypothetical protein [Phycisphaerales bacterium]
MQRNIMTTIGWASVMATSSAMADISPIGSFEADVHESFNSFPGGFVSRAVRVFDDNASVFTDSGSDWVHTTGSWGFK